MIMQSDIDRVMQQLRAAMLNKPVSQEFKTEAPELKELESAIEYLRACLCEFQEYSRDLCAGHLNVEPPGRHNFIAGSLKELHSILKHLTWQTAQVAGGDYSQKVRFLGEFSDSFNIMISQLKEREERIQKKSNALSESMSLLRSILNAQQDFVVVTDAENGQVIYANLSAERRFYNPVSHRASCSDYEELMRRLRCTDSFSEKEFEYACNARGVMLAVQSFPIEWNEQRSFVHCIRDITDEREKEEKLQTLAYKDTLTGAYNRRYCIQKLTKFKQNRTPFSLIVIDLDGLKQVNDYKGHTDGDDYIKTVAQGAQHFSRAADKLCRIGGDEFVLLLPNCSEINAHKKMQDICTHLSHLEKNYTVSISYGVIYVDSTSEGSCEDWLATADAKMYEMKQQHKRMSSTEN